MIIINRDRNGGYTRIMRCGYRTGDKAPMCYIEYIDRWGNERGMRSREGELRACRKVGEETKAVASDTKQVETTSAAESIDEQIEKIVSVPDLSALGSADVHPQVKLSEEETRKLSDQIAFK